MKHEPALDRSTLAEAVGAAYGLSVRSATFVPVGYAAACYVLDCGAAGRRFLKVWPDTAAGRLAGAGQSRVLPLLRAVQERGLPVRVAAPLPTGTGALSWTFDSGLVALFPFVDGTTPPGWPGWGPAVWEELGRTLAAIHGATPALADVLPPMGSGDAELMDELRGMVEALGGIEPDARPDLSWLRRTLTPLRAELLGQLDRLAEVRDRCAAVEAPGVLCHADLGGDNVMIDRAGRLWALDWDDATVAPPELDLRVGVEGPHLGPFLRAYRAAGGLSTLSRDRFELFLLRRALGDTHARLVRLLGEDVGPAEAAELIDGILRWGVAEWRALEERLAAVGESLRSLPV